MRSRSIDHGQGDSPLRPHCLLHVLLSGSSLSAQTIYPIDRAEILAGAQFDFKVEFPDRVDPAKLKVTVNGDGLCRRVRP